MIKSSCRIPQFSHGRPFAKVNLHCFVRASAIHAVPTISAGRFIWCKMTASARIYRVLRTEVSVLPYQMMARRRVEPAVPRTCGSGQVSHRHARGANGVETHLLWAQWTLRQAQGRLGVRAAFFDTFVAWSISRFGDESPLPPQAAIPFGKNALGDETQAVGAAMKLGGLNASQCESD
jgi:hypothetical protein